MLSVNDYHKYEAKLAIKTGLEKLYSFFLALPITCEVCFSYYSFLFMPLNVIHDNLQTD